jgi:hypothetical protein
MSPQPFRLQPQMSPESYNTYSITSPRDVMIKAACEQVGCAAWLHGWESTIDESTACGLVGRGLCRWVRTGNRPCGVCQANYIRTQSGREFRERRTTAGLTVFRFEPRQRCFAEHKTRPESYVVARGDWRRSAVTRVHANAADWTEDFALHQQNLADRLNQG